MPKDDPLLSQREAASYLSVSLRTLQRWRKEGVAPASVVMPSGRHKYRQSSLDHWLIERGDRPPAE